MKFQTFENKSKRYERFADENNHASKIDKLKELLGNEIIDDEFSKLKYEIINE